VGDPSRGHYHEKDFDFSIGLERATHLALFLSRAATRSSWIDHELNAGLYRVISSGTPKIIPVMLENCAVPALVAGFAAINAGNDSLKIAEALEWAISGRSPKPSIKCIAL
jgi:TIR domain